MIVKAYAKINLRLKVLGIDERRYHFLQMLNAKIGLHDILKIKRIKTPNIIVEMAGVSQENNLVYKVAKEMFEKYHLKGGIYIKIKKNIPFGAGLGGGSADAAVVIKTMNKMYNLNLSKETLQKIAFKFGTDIVYCLENELALVEGFGEKITILNRKIKSDVLIINPKIEISTKDIYNKYDSLKKYSEKLDKEEFENIELKKMLDNDLEECVFLEYPKIKKIKEEIIREGFGHVLMSGSGSTIFVLGEKQNLKQLYKKYQEYNVYLTKIK